MQLQAFIDLAHNSKFMWYHFEQGKEKASEGSLKNNENRSKTVSDRHGKNW